MTSFNSGRVLKFYNFASRQEAEELGFPELESNIESFFCTGIERGRDARFGVGFGVGFAILLIPFAVACCGAYSHLKNKKIKKKLNKMELQDLP